MDFKIQLRDHLGERKSREGVISKIDFNQYQIFVIGGEELKKLRGKEEELIGYVSKRPGDPICYIKSAAAYGEPTLKIFNQLIRSELLSKLREVIAAAKEARAEAEALKAETEQMASQQLELETEKMYIEQASRMAIDAIAESDTKLREASEAIKLESASDRSADIPVPDAVAATKGTLAVDSGDSQSEADLANAQNL